MSGTKSEEKTAGAKMHKIGNGRRDVLRALKKYPAFQETSFEAWATRFEHLAEMADKDGSLDHPRFDRFCKLAIGMKKGTSEFLFNCFDTDGSGTVSASEFISCVSLLLKGTLKQKLAMAFSAYDTNADGYVSMEELYAGMMAAKGLSIDDFDAEVADHVKTVLTKLDKDKDGRVTKDEFVAAVLADTRLVDEIGTWLRTSKVLSEPQYVMLKALFKDVDQDNSGKISLHEMASFAKMCLPGKQRMAEKKATRILGEMDRKGYDGVDLDEWIQFFEHMYEGKSEDAVTQAIIKLRNNFKA